MIIKYLDFILLDQVETRNKDYFVCIFMEEDIFRALNAFSHQ